MRNLLVALTVLLSTASIGCLADVAETVELDSALTAPASAMNHAVEKRELLDEAPADLCAVLPESGPCALACDPDALVDRFVPQGTCVTFRCELTTGEVFQTGGCNP